MRYTIISAKSKESKAVELYNYLMQLISGNETCYEDVIIDCVGEDGLYLLKESGLIESCGVFNGRKLYAI